MTDNISKKQNNYKYIKMFVVILNVIGIACLVYFTIPFIIHDSSVVNHNTRLASYSWDSCGFILTLGLIPLIIANTMAFIFFDLRKKSLKGLFFIPSLVCLILVSCYLFISFNEEEKYEPELVSSAKCELNGRIYHYHLYKEKDGTYSSSIDEYNKIPLDVINYESEAEWLTSIETYHQNHGGICP